MNTTPGTFESNKNKPEDEKTTLFGLFYFMLGIIGLASSGYALVYNLESIPIFETVIAGVLISALSILVINYGYRVIRRDS